MLHQCTFTSEKKSVVSSNDKLSEKKVHETLNRLMIRSAHSLVFLLNPFLLFLLIFSQVNYIYTYIYKIAKLHTGPLGKLAFYIVCVCTLEVRVVVQTISPPLQPLLHRPASYYYNGGFTFSV